MLSFSINARFFTSFKFVTDKQDSIKTKPHLLTNLLRIINYFLINVSKKKVKLKLNEILNNISIKLTKTAI